MNPVFEIEHLSKTFKNFWGRPKKKALQNLNLKLEQGQVLGLIGPNGAGKTTTMKILLGLSFATQGKVRLFGQPPTNREVKSRLGFLPEESYLYRFLNARETLVFFGRLFGMSKKEIDRKIPSLLETVGLTSAGDQPVKEFSKGMARRLTLAQALINEPELLILDEPTSGLDPIGSRLVKEIILEQKSKGKSILVSSHLLVDIEEVCDEIAMLIDGKLHLHGRVDELLERQDQIPLTHQDPRKSLEQLFFEAVSYRRKEPS